MTTLNHKFAELFVILGADDSLAVHRSFEQLDAAQSAIASIQGTNSTSATAADLHASLTDFVKDDVSGQWMPLRLRLAAQWAR